ncbi:MAG: WcaF family extracellular polysaccharide biosynthesis acetyltransferase [Candidatus Omnitrophota bacterium]|nr:WcaF family extracellular polysaccharide biosynthesis acetyltransferase [Candidatus Omnitrophota bacterium]
MPGTVHLEKFNNSWYKPGGIMKRVLWTIAGIIFIQNSLPWPVILKCLILRCFGAKIGRGVIIKPSVNIKYPWFLKVGDHSWIGEGVWIDNLAEVVIGSNVCVSQGAYIFTGNHDYKKETFDLMVKPVILEDGSWVGARAVVCPGLTVGSHSVITAGSIATKDAEAYKIYRGNPAEEVRERHIEG